MSAPLFRAVIRLPLKSQISLLKPTSVFNHSGPAICLATYGLRYQIHPLYRGYANQSNDNQNPKKEKKQENLEDKNVQKETKPSPHSDASGFRHFFNQNGGKDESGKDLKANKEKTDFDENHFYGNRKNEPQKEEKKESVAERVERMIRESKEATSKRQNQDASQENPDGKQTSDGDQQTGKGLPPPPSPKKPQSPFDAIFNFNNLWLSISLAYILYRLLDNAGDSREITWQEFRTAFLDKGLVDKLTVVNDNKVKVTLHSNATGQMYPEGAPRATRYYFTIGSVEAFERRLDEAQKELGIPSKDRIPVAYSHEISYAAILTSLLPLLVVVATLTWLSRRVGGAMGGGGRGRGSIFDFASSKAKMFNVDQKINVTFKDVAGLDEAKEEIVEFVKFLKEPQTYERLGAKIPRGAILSGPPGTGKTLLAKATAGEAGVPFLSVSGSEFVEMFVGVGAARVRDLFAQAKKNQPSIIFIDEIDAIGKARDRGKFRIGNDEREQTLNQILVEMDGFGTSEHVVVLAGTNRVDTLDPALMRPGRFDRHIAIDGPDLSGRKQIFEVHLRKLKLADPVEDLSERLSVLTAGFTGADIANACNEAALIAARYKADAVALKHFEQAIERVTAGLEKKSRVLSPEDKNQVAYHEAGHAVAGWNLEWVDPLLKVSIVPRARALGYASYLPKDEYMTSKRKVLDRMVMALAGRVSEEIFFGDDAVGSGASDDFRKVTNWATTYVTTWGMSKRVGPVYYASSPDEIQKPFSEETAKIIDEEVKKIIMEAYQRTHELLTEHREDVVKLAAQLMEYEVLTYRDVEQLIGPRKYPTKGVDLSKILGEESGFGRLVPRKETEEPPIAATAPITKPNNGESTAA